MSIRIILLMSILFSFNNNAMANWVVIANNEKIDAYFNFTTIKKNKNIVNIELLIDFKEEQDGDQNDKFLSVIGQSEFDCKNNIFSYREQKAYPEHMGKGNVIKTTNLVSNENIHPPMGTVIYRQLEVACKIANWTFIGNTEYGGFSEFVDLNSIKRKGNKVKMWSLRNFSLVQKVPSIDNFFSIISLDEYDCKEDTIEVLMVIWYSEHMGYGNVIHKIKDVENFKEAAIPNSVAKMKLNSACLKRQ
jgi:hypothetical protein